MGHTLEHSFIRRPGIVQEMLTTSAGQSQYTLFWLAFSFIIFVQVGNSTYFS